MQVGDKLILEGYAENAGVLEEVVIRGLHPIAVTVTHPDGDVRSYYIGPQIQVTGCFPRTSWRIRAEDRYPLAEASVLPRTVRARTQGRPMKTDGTLLERVRANIQP